MGAPRLNRRLVLEARSDAPDGAGGFAPVWVPLGTLWADVDARTGRDRAGEEAALSNMTHRILVRAAPHGAPSRPEPGQRLRDGSRAFVIMAVAERDARARYLICFAEEEVSL